MSEIMDILLHLLLFLSAQLLLAVNVQTDNVSGRWVTFLKTNFINFRIVSLLSYVILSLCYILEFFIRENVCKVKFPARFFHGRSHLPIQWQAEKFSFVDRCMI